MMAPERRGEAVPEVQIGDEMLASGSEEPLRPKPPLELLQSAGSLVNVERRHYPFSSASEASIGPVRLSIHIRTTLPTRASV